VALTVTTARLLVTEATEDDVDGLLEVALSNPEFTGHHEGSSGGPGEFDRGMLERDLAVAWSDPARHPLALRNRADPARVVGWAEVLDEHPRDLVPWIGLLEVHRRDQGRGYGREAVGAMESWARHRGAQRLRLGVDDDNVSAAAFWRRLGFREVDHRERVGPSGLVGVTVMEISLASGA
jgi:RimJ/RimL family protein N-acetyltransferase